MPRNIRLRSVPYPKRSKLAMMINKIRPHTQRLLTVTVRRTVIIGARIQILIQRRMTRSICTRLAMLHCLLLYTRLANVLLYNPSSP